MITDLPNSPFANKSHHGESGFRNPPGSGHSRDGRYSVAMLGLMAELALSGNRHFTYPASHVVSRSDALGDLQRCYRDDAISWLGQACFYMKVGGVSILTDPFLSHRASPMSFSGPRRLVPSPIHINDIPEIDVIVISHNHYDHLDVKTLARWHDKSTPVVTTLGTGGAIRKLGFSRVIELDWYQQTMIKGAQLSCFPAYHFSGRSLWDANKALWGSFSIQSGGRSVFFSGDTGYGSEFKRVGKYLGGIDIALVPIGAYSPREIMAKVHVSPEEAIAIGRDVGARFLIPMHWGTVRLTNEPMMEPKYRFELEMRKQSKCRPEIKGKVFAIGESQVLADLM